MNYDDAIKYINEQKYDLKTRYLAAVTIGNALRTNGHVEEVDKLTMYGYWKQVFYITNDKILPPKSASFQNI